MRPMPLAGLTAVILLLTSGIVPAQETPEPPANEPPGQVWSAELPGGKFGVSLRSITSVSMHEYVVDGAARVSEVVIATNGSLIGRFYFLEPIRPTTPSGIGQSALNTVIEKIEQGVDRTGVEPVWKKVMKSYPTTTHAHTVEYRLETRDQVDKLFEHADKSWRSRRPGTFKGE